MADLTLICPTVGRHKYVERSVRFWSGRNEFYLLYIDGSTDPLRLDWDIHKNITYIHREGSYADRVLSILDIINTPYACMICDDEFFIPSALKVCLEFLDSHPDYVACSGRSVGFSRYLRSVVFRDQYPLLHNRDLDEDAPVDRLSTHFKAYVPAHLYAVTRTDVFKKSIKCALKTELDLYALFELVEEFMVVAQGKSCVIPHLCWLRSFEEPPIRNNGDTYFDPSKGFTKWWLELGYIAIKSRLEFCDRLATTTNYTLTASQVYDVFDSYVQAGLLFESSRNGSVRRRIEQLLYKLPAPIYQVIKIIKRLAARLLRVYERRSALAIRKLHEQGVTIDRVDLGDCISTISSSS